MAAQLDIAEARRRSEELLARASAGEEFVVLKEGQPVVRIVPVAAGNGKRIFGEFAGKVHMSDDFATPLTGDELAEWEK